MDSILNDVKYALRGLRNSPTVTVIAVVALSLGIGLTTVMFSIVYGALHRGLPFEGGERIMHLERANLSQDINSMEVTIHDYRHWRERQRSFNHLGAFYSGTVTIRGTERAERYRGAFMTANSFDVLGVQPILGRGFRDEEEQVGAPQVVLLGHQVWQERFGGAPDVLGQVVTINGEAGQVIGVMPEGFEFPLLQEVWVPLRLDHLTLERGTGTTLEVFGDLREGISVDQAMVEFSGITTQIANDFPETNEGITALMKPYTEEYIGDEPRTILYSMLFTVILVLVMACANVANLLLARAAMRTRDIAIRTAMGAERWRVVSQLLAEAFVLAIVGAGFGIGIAYVGITLFDRAVSVTDPPFWLVFQLDAPIFLFVAAIAGFAALVAGILPAVKASSTDVNSILQDQSRGSSGMQIGMLSRTLVIAEIAMSMAMLVASGLMIKGVVNLNNEDYGFSPDNVFSARVASFEDRFPDAEARLRFWEDLEQRVAGLPGVESVTITGSLPGAPSFGARLAVDGVSYEATRDMPVARFVAATPSYQEVLDIEVVQGRWLDRTDVTDAPGIAVVNEAFVVRHFPEGQALGRRIRLGGLESENEWLEIVGIVPNLRMEGIGNDDDGEINIDGFYVPLAQYDLSFASIVARTTGETMEVTTGVRDAVAAADADTPIYFEQTLQEAIDQNVWFYRVFGNLFLAFGLSALFLASVGLYGVMSFSVSRRIQEMGIRMALGAEARQVVKLVLRQGMGQIAIGLLLGTGLAYLVARTLTLVLYQVEPGDPVTYTAVIILLTVTGGLASAVPAWRATKVDPMEALRYE